jgi:hypothetical protein
MAVKKSTTPKTSGTPKAASTKKAAPKKATSKKPTPKKSTMPAQAKAKPAGVKKAAAIKLSDSQTRVLGAVNQAGETGYAAGKGEGKVLESLLNKKLVKRGKKVEGVARFLVTKAGAKQASAPAAPAAPANSTPETASAPAPSPTM